jgi:hypothetical protein
MIVNDEDIKEMQRLCTLKTADMVDKSSCELMIQRYIDPGYKFCKTCEGAVRTAFKRLRTWSEANGIIK